MKPRLRQWTVGDLGTHPIHGPFLVVEYQHIGQWIRVLWGRTSTLSRMNLGGTMLNASRRVSEAESATAYRHKQARRN